jgi:hypothetical protein
MSAKKAKQQLLVLFSLIPLFILFLIDKKGDYPFWIYTGISVRMTAFISVYGIVSTAMEATGTEAKKAVFWFGLQLTALAFILIALVQFFA